MKIVIDTKYVTVNAGDVMIIIQVIILVAANYVLHKTELNMILKAGILTVQLLLLMYYFLLMLIEMYEEWEMPSRVLDIASIRNLSFLCEFISIIVLFYIYSKQIRTDEKHKLFYTKDSMLNKTAQAGGLYICVLARKLFTKDKRSDMIQFIFSLIFISFMLIAIIADYVVYRRRIDDFIAASSGNSHRFRNVTLIFAMFFMPIGSLFKKNIEKDILLLKIGCSVIAVLYIIGSLYILYEAFIEQPNYMNILVR
ncbi:hypothetical protein CWI40_040820 [Ordospora colligata]|nr:hypothetical protein CWI40_040820 [Ordospora colligata]